MVLKKMKILFCGEGWQKTNSDYKGCDFTTSGYCEVSIEWIRNALENQGIEFQYLPTIIAQQKFPDSPIELVKYDAVFLGDNGSNNLLLHPDTLKKSMVRPNRLSVLKEYVGAGGEFAMISGSMSFQGKLGKANYKEAAIVEILPV